MLEYERVSLFLICCFMKKISLLICCILLFWVWFGSPTITEVRYDGTDERIEITNVGELFSGEVQVIWAKSTPIAILLDWFKENESRIFGDKLDSIDVTSITHQKDLGFSIKDTSLRSISLNYSGNEISNFSPDLETIEKENNKDTSLSVYTTTDWETTIQWSVPSPGNFSWETYTLEAQDPTTEEEVDIESQANTQQLSWDTQIWIWENEILLLSGSAVLSWSEVGTWDSNNWTWDVIAKPEEDNNQELVSENQDSSSNQEEEEDNKEAEKLTSSVGANLSTKKDTVKDPDRSQHLQYQGITIEEIHQSDTDFYGEYVELKAHQNYRGPLIIDGLWQWSGSKTVDISVSAWEIFVITDKSELLETPYNISSISLTDGGESLLIRGQTGQVIDNVVYSKWNKGSSLYFSETTWEVRHFWSIDIPTPRYNKQHIKHLLEKDTQLDCSIHIQNKSHFYHTNSVNLIAAIDQKHIQNSNQKYVCLRTTDSSTFESEKCNPSGVTFDTIGVEHIWLNITTPDGRHCSTSIDINLAEKIEIPSCRETYYEWLYSKRKDKFTNECKASSSSSKTSSTSAASKSTSKENGDFDGSAGENAQLASIEKSKTLVIEWELLVDALLPNPKGKDGETEWIRLHNLWSTNIDISWLIVNAGKRQRSIGSWVIEPWVTLEYFWDLWLYNRDACIRLEHISGHIFDEFCYPKPKDDERYTLYNPEDISWEEETFDGEYDHIAQNTANWACKTQEPTTPAPDKIKTINANKHISYSAEILEDSVLAAPHKEIRYGELQIDWLLPNPKWADGEFEWIRLTNSGEEKLYLNDFVINAGKRSANILGEETKNIYLESGKSIELTWKFGLYNNSACIRVESKSWSIFDEFCYPKPKDDVWYSKQNSLRYTDIASTERLSTLWLAIQDNEVCITTNDNQVLCKTISAIGKYEKEKEKRSKDKIKYESTINTLKNQKSQISLENKLHEEFIYSTIQTIRSDRSPVYYNTNIANSYANRKELKTALTRWDDTIDFGLISLEPKEITTALKIYNKELPLAEIEMDVVLDELLTETKQTRNTFKNNLKIDWSDLPLVVK